jgi:hypothetical protein
MFTRIVQVMLMLVLLFAFSATALTIADPTIADHLMLSATGWNSHVAIAALMAPAAITKGAFSIREWCLYRGYSIATFYKMKKNGMAPKVTQPPGTPPRITQEADAEWLERVNNLKGKSAETAVRDAELRRDRAVAAASKAIASPAHIANRRRGA